MSHRDANELPFKLVHQPSELPSPDDIERGAPSTDGVFAVGFQINADWVETAYRRGLFPWYNEGEPVLWHCPNPRMVLALDEFKISHSLGKKIRTWARHPDMGYRITFNRAFHQVISQCAETTRRNQSGTWISRDLARAYTALHERGQAISVELWHNDQLIAGLYGVLLGRMFFGESMFTHISDGSKIALACWVDYFQAQGGQWIDCQQVTRHLSSLGARPISRTDYFTGLAQLLSAPPLDLSPMVACDNALLRFCPTPPYAG